MEKAFFLSTHCSFLTRSRLPNEGKDVARGGDPASVAAYVLQRSRMGWPRNGRLHIQDMRLTPALRERQVEELHQEEPTPVADVARSGSYSGPRKLRLPIMFFQIPNHWRKCQERRRRSFFHIILFLLHFTVYMYLQGGRGGRFGCKYEASLSATGNRRPTGNIFTCDQWRSERPSQRHKPSPEHTLQVVHNLLVS